MSMTDAWSRIKRWRDVVTGETTASCYKNGNYNILTDGDRIYSYGRHFELARAVRDAKGKVSHFLVNGDTYSVTTSKHQSHLRGVLHRETTVLIPYESLKGAGIDLDTVKILEVTQDTHRVEERHSDTQPENTHWVREEVHGYRPLTDEELFIKLQRKRNEARVNRAYRVVWHKESPHIHRDPGEFDESQITLDDREMKYYGVIGHRDVLRWKRGTENQQAWQEIAVRDGQYHWETHHHRLGESLIRGKVSWHTIENGEFKRHSRWGTYLSGWDTQESRPLYFLCMLPRSFKGTTVAEAYEALKPDAVVMGEALGRPVVRQGDIFAVSITVATKLSLKRQGARFEKRGNLLGTNHEATEVAYLPDGTTMARGVLYHNPDRRLPDHARRRMTDGWNVVVKNTVPVTKAAKRTRRNAA